MHQKYYFYIISYWYWAGYPYNRIFTEYTLLKRPTPPTVRPTTAFPLQPGRQGYFKAPRVIGRNDVLVETHVISVQQKVFIFTKSFMTQFAIGSNKHQIPYMDGMGDLHFTNKIIWPFDPKMFIDKFVYETQGCWSLPK